jgi:hypothetical protein
MAFSGAGPSPFMPPPSLLLRTSRQPGAAATGTAPSPPDIKQPTALAHSEDNDYVDVSEFHDTEYIGTCMAGRVGIGFMGGFLLSFCAMLLQPKAVPAGQGQPATWEANEITKPMCIVFFLVSSSFLKYYKCSTYLCDSAGPRGLSRL